jgi:hypothetical protein
MFKLFNHHRHNTPRRTAKPSPLPEKRIAAFERHRLADTDGTRRRMLQTVEANRLL